MWPLLTTPGVSECEMSVCMCVCVLGGVKVDETVPVSMGSAWTCPCSVILECSRKENVIQTDWLPLTNKIKRCFLGGLTWNIFSIAGGCKCMTSPVGKCCWCSSKVSKNAVQLWKKSNSIFKSMCFPWFYWQITLHFRITWVFFLLSISKQQLTFNLTTMRCFSAQFEFLIIYIPHFSSSLHVNAHIYKSAWWYPHRWAHLQNSWVRWRGWEVYLCSTSEPLGNGGVKGS